MKITEKQIRSLVRQTLLQEITLGVFKTPRYALCKDTLDLRGPSADDSIMGRALDLYGTSGEMCALVSLLSPGGNDQGRASRALTGKRSTSSEDDIYEHKIFKPVDKKLKNNNTFFIANFVNDRSDDAVDKDIKSTVEKLQIIDSATGQPEEIALQIHEKVFSGLTSWSDIRKNVEKYKSEQGLRELIKFEADIIVRFHAKRQVDASRMNPDQNKRYTNSL